MNRTTRAADLKSESAVPLYLFVLASDLSENRYASPPPWGHAFRSDAKRNVLVYLVYTDKLIEGSPENSTSTVPIIRWGGAEPQRCGDWLKE